MDETSTTTASRGRVLAFRIVAGAAGVLLGVANIVYGLAPLVDETQRVHSFHTLVPLWVYSLLVVVPLVVLVFVPDDVVALRVPWAVSIGTVIASLIGEDLVSGSYFVVPIILLIVTILAPNRGQLLRFGSPNIAMLSLAAIAAIPVIVYAWDNARMMVAMDPATDMSGHWKFHHWSGIAGAMLGLVLAAVVVAFRRRGDRLWPWMVGLAAMLVGVTGMVYADDVRYPSSIGTWWGVIALFAGIVYIAIAEISGGAAPSDEDAGA
jgi:hypothetical protein